MELKIKLKWFYGFFSQTVYEHLLPVNYIVSKERISRYHFNRSLFEIIKPRIIYYPRMGRRQVWGFVSMMTIKKKKNCGIRNLVGFKNRIF